MNRKQGIETDVLIVGGGLVGSALAVTFDAAGVATVLVEARDPAQLDQESFDGRVTALANGSQRILEQLGLWPQLQDATAPIRHIHIGEQGRFGAARIAADEEGVAALGYTVENRVLGRVLWDRLQSARQFDCVAPGRLVSFDAGDDGIAARVDTDAGSHSVRAKLLVAADGARSSVRAALGIAAHEDDYAQEALIFNCTTEHALNGRAFERFTPQGPLALLPLSGGRAAVVWTLQRREADIVAGLSDGAFRARLQAAFGYRLGHIARVGRRDRHVLRRVRSDAVSARRTVLIGNAAVSLHPVAGQGFNLALRDVATLAEVVSDALHSPAADIGADAVLQRYRDWRARDQRTVARFTHGLVRGFGVQLPGLGAARGLGLLAFDVMPGAKAWLARQTMGMTGRLPRLARGLPL